MIELLVKTVGRNAYKINVNLDDTVADVKRAIEIETSRLENVYPVSRLVIVHAGKILKDDTATLKENGVTEKSHLIILKSPNERGSGGESSSAPAAVEAPRDASASSTGQATDSAAQTTLPRDPASTGINVSPRDTRGAHATGLSTNEGRHRNLTSSEGEAVDRLVAMGFSRVVAMEAFLVCDRNEEQAANYLADHIEDI